MNLHWDEARSESLSSALQYCFAFLRRQIWLLAFGIVLGVTLFLLTLVKLPGQFEATATVLFDPKRIQVVSNPMPDGSIDSSTGLESQVQIIASPEVAHIVMERLKLYDDPDFAPPTRTRTERWFGTWVAERLGKAGPRSKEWVRAYQLDAFLGSLKVRRVLGTYAVSITYESHSAARAAEIANAIADAFIEKELADRRESLRHVSAWLKNRLEELRIQVTAAKDQLNEFRAVHNLMDGAGLGIVERKIADLNTQLISELAKISETSARLERVDVAVREYGTAEVKPSVPDLMNNAVVMRLREQYFQLTNKRAEFVARLAPTHEAVRKIDQKIAETHAAMLDEYRRLAESYRSNLEISRLRETDIKKALGDAAKELQLDQTARIKLRELETTAKTIETLQDGFMRRYTEASEQEAYPFARATPLSRANEPLGRNHKKPLKIALILLSFGVMVGGAGALLRELMDRTFRRLNDVERTLGSNLISVVPVWRRKDTRAMAGLFNPAPKLTQSPRTITRTNDLVWVADVAPHSQYAESIRAIKLHLDRHQNPSSANVVGVASIQPSEGSSSMANAMAVAMAAGKSRVILVDLDLRNPALTRRLAPKAELGLVDVLLGEAELSEVLWHDARTGMAFLPVASLHGGRPDETLASDALNSLIERLRAEYDYVIIDLPPVVPMLDVTIASRFIDSFVGVVAWGISEKELTRLALERSPAFRERLIGVVMNMVDMSKLSLFDPSAAQWFDEKRYVNYRRLDLKQSEFRILKAG